MGWPRYNTDHLHEIIVNTETITDDDFNVFILQTMDMTVAELQNAVYHNMSAAPTQPASQFPIQQVTFDHMGVSAAKKVSDATSSASSPVSKGKG